MRGPGRMMEELGILGSLGELVPWTTTLNCFELPAALVKDGGGGSPAFGATRPGLMGLDGPSSPELRALLWEGLTLSFSLLRLILV